MPTAARDAILAIAHGQCSLAHTAIQLGPGPLACIAPQHYRRYPPSLAFSALQLLLLVFMYR